MELTLKRMSKNFDFLEQPDNGRGSEMAYIVLVKFGPN